MPKILKNSRCRKSENCSGILTSRIVFVTYITFGCLFSSYVSSLPQDQQNFLQPNPTDSQVLEMPQLHSRQMQGTEDLPRYLKQIKTSERYAISGDDQLEINLSTFFSRIPDTFSPSRIVVTTEQEIKNQEYITYFKEEIETKDLRKDVGSVIDSCEFNFSRKMAFTDQGVGLMIALKNSGQDVDTSFGQDGTGVKYFDFKSLLTADQSDVVTCQDCAFDFGSKTYYVVCSLEIGNKKKASDLNNHNKDESDGDDPEKKRQARLQETQNRNLTKKTFLISLNDEKILESVNLEQFKFANLQRLILPARKDKKTILLIHDISISSWDQDLLAKNPKYFYSKINLVEILQNNPEGKKFLDRGLMVVETDLNSLYNFGPFFDSIQAIGIQNSQAELMEYGMRDCELLLESSPAILKCNTRSKSESFVPSYLYSAGFSKGSSNYLGVIEKDVQNRATLYSYDTENADQAEFQTLGMQNILLYDTPFFIEEGTKVQPNLEYLVLDFRLQQARSSKFVFIRYMDTRGKVYTYFQFPSFDVSRTFIVSDFVFFDVLPFYLQLGSPLDSLGKSKGLTLSKMNFEQLIVVVKPLSKSQKSNQTRVEAGKNWFGFKLVVCHEGPCQYPYESYEISVELNILDELYGDPLILNNLPQIEMFVKDFEVITIKQELISRGNDIRYEIKHQEDVKENELRVYKFDKSSTFQVKYRLIGYTGDVGTQGLPNDAISLLIFEQFVIFQIQNTIHYHYCYPNSYLKLMFVCMPYFTSVLNLGNTKLSADYSYLFPALVVTLESLTNSPQTHILIVDLNLKSQQILSFDETVSSSLVSSTDYDIYLAQAFTDRVELYKMGNGFPHEPEFIYRGTKGEKINLSNLALIEKIERKQSSILTFNNLDYKKSLLKIAVKSGFILVEEFYPLSIFNQDQALDGMCVFDSEIITWNLQLSKIWTTRANIHTREFSSMDLKSLPISQIFNTRNQKAEISGLKQVHCFPEEKIFVVVVGQKNQIANIGYSIICTEEADNLLKRVYKNGQFLVDDEKDIFVGAEQKMVTLGWKNKVIKDGKAITEWGVQQVDIEGSKFILVTNFETDGQKSTAKSSYNLIVEASSGQFGQQSKKKMPATINVIDPIIHTEEVSLGQIEYVEGDENSIRYNLDSYFTMKGNNFGIKLKFDRSEIEEDEVFHLVPRLNNISKKAGFEDSKQFCGDGIYGTIANFACFYRKELKSELKTLEEEPKFNSCLDIFIEKKLVKTLELGELAYNLNYVPIETESKKRSVLAFTKIDKSIKIPLLQLRLIDFLGQNSFEIMMIELNYGFKEFVVFPITEASSSAEKKSDDNKKLLALVGRTYKGNLQILLVRYDDETRQVRTITDVTSLTNNIELKDVISVSGFVHETRLHIYYLVKFQTVITKIVLEFEGFSKFFAYSNRSNNYIITEQVQTGLNSVEVTDIKCNYSEASGKICLVDTKGTKIWVVDVSSAQSASRSTRLYKPFDFDCLDMDFALNYVSVSCQTKFKLENGQEKRQTYLLLYSTKGSNDKFAIDRLLLKEEVWNGSRYTHSYLLDQNNNLVLYQENLKNKEKIPANEDPEPTKFSAIEVGEMELVTNLSYKKFLKIKPVLEIRSQNFDGDQVKVLELIPSFFVTSGNMTKRILFSAAVILAMVFLIVCCNKNISRNEGKKFEDLISKNYEELVSLDLDANYFEEDDDDDEVENEQGQEQAYRRMTKSIKSKANSRNRSGATFWQKINHEKIFDLMHDSEDDDSTNHNYKSQQELNQAGNIETHQNYASVEDDQRLEDEYSDGEEKEQEEEEQEEEDDEEYTDNSEQDATSGEEESSLDQLENSKKLEQIPEHEKEDDDP